MPIKQEKLVDIRGKLKRRSMLLMAAAGAISYVSFSQKIFGTNFLFNGYSRDFSFSFSYPGVWTHGGKMAKAVDGGYVISVDGGSSSNIVKINALGKQEWVRMLIGSDDGSSFKGKGVTIDGNQGYLLIGNTDSHDLLGREWSEAEAKRTRLMYQFTPKMALISKINLRGEVVWQKIYGDKETNYVSSAQHVIPVINGGFIVFGVRTIRLPDAVLGGRAKTIQTPWIFKIDTNGEVQSEFSILEVNGIAVKSPSGEDIFSKPVIDSHGNIFVVVETEEIKHILDENGIDKLNAGLFGGVRNYLLLKLDQNGKELRRYQLNTDTLGIPVIVSAEAGIEMFRLNDEDTSSDKLPGFVHFRFDSELKLISSKFIAEEKFRVDAATRSGENSFHLFGIEYNPGSDSGHATLAYLNKDGVLEYKKRFGGDYWPNDIAAGNKDNEVLVFYNTDSSDVTKVEKFTLKI